MSAARPEVVLVTVGELGSGAYEAHVLALAERASPHALVHQATLVSPRMRFTRSGRAVLAREVARSRAIASGRVAVALHGPRLRGLRFGAWQLARAVRSVRSGAGPLVLHCRNYQAALLAGRARVPGARVLFDVRGARAEEVRLHGGELPAETVERLTVEALAGADAVCCVSAAMRDWLREHHGVEGAEVFPCAADTSRFVPDEDARGDVRALTGAGERFVLGFVGSAAGWQRPDAVARLLLRIRARRPDAVLLVLSPDRAAWSRALEAAGLEVDAPDAPRPGAAAHVRSVPHADVPRWMAACDATALLRDRDLVNRVASPIKFGESLACGVPVLVTEGVGDASGLVAAEGLGAVFSDALLGGPDDARRLDAFLERQAADRRGLAAACRDAAVRLWSWDAQLPRWLALYDRLSA